MSTEPQDILYNSVDYYDVEIAIHRRILAYIYSKESVIFIKVYTIMSVTFKVFNIVKSIINIFILYLRFRRKKYPCEPVHVLSGELYACIGDIDL